MVNAVATNGGKKIEVELFCWEKKERSFLKLTLCFKRVVIHDQCVDGRFAGDLDTTVLRTEKKGEKIKHVGFWGIGIK